MYTLLDTCLDRLDIFEFLSHVEDGLKDHYDIKVSTVTCLFTVQAYNMYRRTPFSALAHADSRGLLD